MALGRTPKPSELRRLQGNPGHRALPKNEPRPRAHCPHRPQWLVGEARKEWERIAPELRRLGLLTTVDRAALAAYCQNYARWLQAEQALVKEGLIFKTDSGYIQQRPEIGIAHKAMALMKAFCQEFGLTPASRTRIAVPEPPKADPFEEWLRSGSHN